MRSAGLSSTAHTARLQVFGKQTLRRARPCAQSTRESHVRQLQEYRNELRARLAAVPNGVQAGVAVESPAIPAPPSSGLLEINQTNYYEYLSSCGDRYLVVVDFFTDWCGPCKVMYPRLVEMAEQYSDKVKIVKFNCNKQNKELGTSLGIRVAPTFFLYRDSKKVAEMTGAKVDQLRSLIEANM